MEDKECPTCKSELREAYAYNSEMASYERVMFNGKPLWRCWNCGYFTETFLRERGIQA